MLLTRSLCLVLTIATSAFATYPIPYPEFHSAPSFGPHLIYSSGIDGNAGLAGFSYFTKDFGGGESEVVFFTGPNSDANMNNEVAAMKDQLGSMLSGSVENQADQKNDKEMMTQDEDLAKTTPQAPVETVETSTSSNKEETAASSTAAPAEEDAKDVGGIPQLLPGKPAGFDTPYPVFRLSGSAAYYPQLPTSFSAFGGHGPRDYFRTQYDPYYNRFNSYQNLYHPYYTSLEADDYYNPIFSSIYRSPLFTPPTLVDNFIPGEFPTRKPSMDVPDVNAIDKVDRRVVNPEEKETVDKVTTRLKADDEPKTEKAPEVPTSTELMSEQSSTTTTSETAPAQSDDIKETTTVSDAVSVP